MVGDDDTEWRDPKLIPTGPTDFTDPQDDKISEAIKNLARRQLTWDRWQILDNLRRDGHQLDEAHVNFVLRKNNLPNLNL
jgi:hypothetical protein